MGVISGIFKKDLWESTNPVVEFFSGIFTNAGETVTPAKAMTISAYFACVRAIAEDIAKITLKTYEEVSDDGKEIRKDHPVYTLLADAPNENMTALSFKETLLQHAQTFGNGYAEIEFIEGSGTPKSLYPIHPTRVEPIVLKDKQVFYKIKNNDNSFVMIPQANIFHLHGMGDDGIKGMSVLKVAAESLGVSLATQNYGASFFANGTALSGVLEYAGWLKDNKAVERLRTQWAEMHAGAKNAHKPAILENGMKWTPLGIPPEDAQFLETRSFQVEDICRWFRVPPVIIGHNTSTPYTNVESLYQAYVRQALEIWAIRIEKEAKRKLFNSISESKYFVRHNFNALMRGDSTTRAGFYRELNNIGVLSINEIRGLENMNSIGPEGDKRLVQLNLTTLEKVGMEEKKEETPAIQESIAEPEEMDQDLDETEEDAKLNLLPLIQHACDTVTRKEQKAVEKAFKRFSDDQKGFNEFVDDFYSKQVDYLSAELMPVIKSLGLASDLKASIVALMIERCQSASVLYANKAIEFKPEKIDASYIEERLLALKELKK